MNGNALNIVDPSKDVQLRLNGDGTLDAIVDGQIVEIQSGGIHEYRVRWNGNYAEMNSLAELTNTLNRWL